MLKLTARVSFVPEHYNRTCRATIPESWEARIVDGLPESNWKHYNFVGLGDTEKEARQSLVEQLRKSELAGQGTLHFQRA